MDLSKAYDCLLHDLLITKFKAHGFDFNRFCLLHSYIDCRHQRVKIGSHRSTAKRIKVGIPQGSVLDPLLFNIFTNDLFLIKLSSEICDFLRITILYICVGKIWMKWSLIWKWILVGCLNGLWRMVWL